MPPGGRSTGLDARLLGGDDAVKCARRKRLPPTAQCPRALPQGSLASEDRGQSRGDPRADALGRLQQGIWGPLFRAIPQWSTRRPRTSRSASHGLEPPKICTRRGGDATWAARAWPGWPHWAHQRDFRSQLRRLRARPVSPRKPRRRGGRPNASAMGSIPWGAPTPTAFRRRPGRAQRAVRPPG